ncbi:MAG: shikimate dehydrogenase [Chloroflexi bacterium]|nr:shikimate dehydrogenase [Chloroflexota bacterium]
MSTRIGLIGFPVAHSQSPRMQGAAFAAAGLDWTYELWTTPLDELHARVQSIREDGGIGGANVTIPHKQNVMPHLDEISTHAQAIGAVNTIVKKTPQTPGVFGDSGSLGSLQSLLFGDNTDWIGFLGDLRWHGVEPTAFTRALVLGAGGSARAIVYALARCGLVVQVANRDPARAYQLVNSLQPLFAGLPLSASALHADDVRASDGAPPILIVNCTSAGMSPNADTTPWPEGAPFPRNAILYDLVYRPARTKLIQHAQAAGLRAIGGIGMLAEQGAAAFERWTGIPATRVSGVMRAALDAVP